MTEQNKSENNINTSAQKELDLEFSQMEPITPKKLHPTTLSLLDKAKEVVKAFGKKNPSSLAPDSKLSDDEIKDNEENNLNDEIDTEDTQTTETRNEPVSRTLNRPEQWAILSFIPTKYRRIFIVVLLALAVLCIISLLRPSAETVNHFEQPENSIPTQFQSLNQEQPVENNVLDNLKQSQSTEQAPKPELQNNNENVVSTPEATHSENSNEVVQPTISSTEQNVVNQIPPASSIPMPSEVEKPQIAPPVEPKKTVEKTKTETKPHNLEPQSKPTVNRPKQESKPQTVKTEKHVSVVEAKPATVSKNVGTRKTLTIPQGVSLMQVFRDNNLNISDVNAMTKANGAGNALSSFKPGDKVQISVNSQGRVEELRLSNGSYFSRQANGTYQYKK